MFDFIILFLGRLRVHSSRMEITEDLVEAKRTAWFLRHGSLGTSFSLTVNAISTE